MQQSGIGGGGLTKYKSIRSTSTCICTPRRPQHVLNQGRLDAGMQLRLSRTDGGGLAKGHTGYSALEMLRSRGWELPVLGHTRILLEKDFSNCLT